jgi:hypothetical protein
MFFSPVFSVGCKPANTKPILQHSCAQKRKLFAEDRKQPLKLTCMIVLKKCALQYLFVMLLKGMLQN